MNPWELTSRERIALVSLWIKTNLEAPSDKDAIDLVDMVQKAAQKKLVEWLKTKGFYHDVGVLSGTTKVILPIFAIEEKNWQELCKGIKRGA